MIIYHGSNEPRPNPIYGFGKTKNDYGRGFYCTENIELAKEWACANGNDGYANMYQINMEGLSVLRLNSEAFHILNWLSILLDNRTFNISEGIASRAKEYLMQHFLPEICTTRYHCTIRLSHVESYLLARRGYLCYGYYKR